MAQKLDVVLPRDTIIGDGWTIEWDAVDPTTGASVSGVVVTQANITAEDMSGGGGSGAFETGPFMLVPGPGA
jgi:hypothetical protein